MTEGADQTTAQAWYREQAEEIGFEAGNSMLAAKLASAFYARSDVAYTLARRAVHFAALSAVSPQGWQPPAEVYRLATEWLRDMTVYARDEDAPPIERQLLVQAVTIIRRLLPSPPRVAAGPEEPT